MPFADTTRLRREIEARIPDRPFTIEFWDRTRLGGTDGSGPTFYVRSPRAAAHVLMAPGQLGLGRAYVSGEIEVDDMDAVIELIDNWQPPSLDGADKRALLFGAARATGLTRPPRRPAARRRSCGRAGGATPRSATRAPSATTTTSPTSSSRSSSTTR